MTYSGNSVTCTQPQRRLHAYIAYSLAVRLCDSDQELTDTLLDADDLTLQDSIVQYNASKDGVKA